MVNTGGAELIVLPDEESERRRITSAQVREPRRERARFLVRAVDMLLAGLHNGEDAADG